jgi:VWFA-related protein
LRRDPATGELRRVPRSREKRPPAEGLPGETAAPAAIRVGVNLVAVGVNVADPGGEYLVGLTRNDFRIFEDGAEQALAHFDASSEPARVALVLDASPSVFRELTEMKQAARTLAAHLAPRDEVAVVAFAAQAHLLLSFSTSRAQLERAIDAVEILRGASDPPGSHIYEAAYLAAELFRESPRRGRKAIVLLTDGQDSGLGLSWDPASALPRSGAAADRLTLEDVCRALTAAGIEVYAVSTQPRPPAMSEEWLARHRDRILVTPEARELGMVHYTLYLAEFVRRVGGRLYFLGEIGTLGDVYRRIAEGLRAQYTLGYYPSAGVTRPGWRTLRIEVKNHSDARLTHRIAYYVPAP